MLVDALKLVVVLTVTVLAVFAAITWMQGVIV